MRIGDTVLLDQGNAVSLRQDTNVSKTQWTTSFGHSFGRPTKDHFHVDCSLRDRRDGTIGAPMINDHCLRVGYRPCRQFVVFAEEIVGTLDAGRSDRGESVTVARAGANGTAARFCPQIALGMNRSVCPASKVF
jgi:hypothetical protein